MQHLQYGINSPLKFKIAHCLPLFRGTLWSMILCVPSLRPASPHLPPRDRPRFRFGLCCKWQYWIQLERITTVLRPLCRSACVSRHLQLRTGRFCRCKVLLPACPCWLQPVHSGWGEDTGVHLNSVIYTVSVRLNCIGLTKQIQRMTSSLKNVSKYWLRKSRPGPISVVSSIDISVLDMWAIYHAHAHAVHSDSSLLLKQPAQSHMWWQTLQKNYYR